MEVNEQRLGIVIAGMHRSGTSALARVLGNLGCDLPNTLLEPNEYNELGYWESREILELNEAILASAGSSWDDWEAFHPDWYESPVAEGFAQRARAVLEKEFGDSRLFVLKDPRVCRLVRFWTDVLNDIGVAPAFALTVRNPLDVAASLEHRDTIHPSIGQLLWLRHVLDAEADSRATPRVFVRYEDLLVNWSDATDRLGRELGISWPKQASSVQIEIETYLTPSQHHHARNDSDLIGSPEVSRWVQTCFEILDRWTHGDVRDSDIQELDTIRAAFDDAGTAFVRPVVAGMRAAQRLPGLETEIRNLNEAVAGREEHIDGLNQAVMDRDSDIASLRDIVSNKDGQIEELNHAVADRDVQIDAMQHKILDRDGRVDALQRAVDDRDGQVESLNQAVADRHAQLESLNQAVADRDGRLESLHEIIANRDGQLESLNQAVADRDGRLESLNQIIVDRDGQLESLNQAVADRDSQVESLSHTVAHRDGQIQSLNQGIADRDVKIDTMLHAILDRDAKVDALQREVDERRDRIESLNQTLADRDSRLQSLNRDLADRDGQLESLNRTLADRDSQLELLNQTISDRDGQLDALSQTVADRDSRIDAMHHTILDRDGQLDVLRHEVSDRDAHIESLDEGISDRDERIEDFLSSTSWRITKPLRALKPILWLIVRAPYVASRLVAVGTLRLVWRLAPLGQSRRSGYKEWLLHFPFFRQFDRTPEQAPAKGYVSSGRVDLATQNHEAHRNGSGVPILFDPDYYLAGNADVREAGVDPLSHYLEYGAMENRLPFDIDPENVDPLISDLHRLDLNSDESFAFDAPFYRALYPDLASLTDRELADHYEQHGQAESRSASMGEFVNQICDNPREIPLDFRPFEYTELYPDLKWLTDESPLEALRHYMRHGRSEPRLHTLRGDGVPDQSHADLELPAALASNSRSVCVLAHVYYPDLWDELAGYLAHLPKETCDLYVNLVDTTFSQGLIAQIREAFPSARIYISENVGRDIGGFFQLLRNIRMEDYRLFCLVHTKKSPHMAKGEVQLWRRKLITPLLGSQECAVGNIQTMLSDEQIGQIGSLACRYTELNDNPDKYFELLDRLDVGEVTRDVEFLSGTMMFLRREVLQRIFETAGDLPFENGDGMSIEFHRDGQWAHAVERAIGAVVRDMNYRIEWVA